MPLREVRLSKDYDTSDYARLQQNWMDRIDRRPIPNTKVYWGDELLVSVNSLGCMDKEPEPNVPTVGFFGDSVVQGLHDGWVSQVKIPGCQTLNGGVEGASLSHIVNQACEVQALHPMVCMVIHPGFHALISGETLFTVWEQQLLRLKGAPIIAHMRITADINDEAVARGYEELYGKNYGRVNHTKTKAIASDFLTAIRKKNALLERLCAQTGRVLIDLDPILAPASYGDLTKRFFDPIHPRPRMYEAMAQSVSAQLTPHVERVLGTWRTPAPNPPTAIKPDAHPLEARGRNYPLW
jgi:hypothetical protein